MCMKILPACLSVHHMCAKWLWMPGEGIGIPRTRATDGCDLPSWFWEQNPDLLEEQSVILTA